MKKLLMHNTNAEDNKTDNPTYDANKFGTKEVKIAVSLKYLSNP